MKLRNKKTGEIVSLQGELTYDDKVRLLTHYNSLAELNEEWEDYSEEPEEYWYVSCDGRALKATTDEDDYNEKHNAGHKEIGNYFETKEEAEKAVEKLKAWKRLKDKGIKITGWETLCGDVCITTNLDILDVSTRESAILDLLFGGEE